MELKSGTFCPLLKKDCIQLKCNWFIQIRGRDVNTGKEVDEWGCSMAWLPHMMIETASQTRQAAAATESFRNEMVKASENSIRAMVELASSNKEETTNATMRLINASDDN